jgi:hypothetical protein
MGWDKPAMCPSGNLKDQPRQNPRLKFMSSIGRVPSRFQVRGERPAKKEPGRVTALALVVTSWHAVRASTCLVTGQVRARYLQQQQQHNAGGASVSES